jgi:hypothetical protein
MPNLSEAVRVLRLYPLNGVEFAWRAAVEMGWARGHRDGRCWLRDAGIRDVPGRMSGRHFFEFMQEIIRGDVPFPG